MSQRYPGKGPMGFLRETYMLTSGAWTFLIPQGMNPDSLFLRVVLPDGWTSAAPWNRVGGYYLPKDLQDLVYNTFGAGRLDIVEKDVQGTKVTIAFDRNFGDNRISALKDKTFPIFNFIKSASGAKTPENHLSLFMASQSGIDEWQWTNENCYSQGEAVSDISGALYQFSHRIFHTYNSFYPNGINQDQTWFIEGPNEYYCALSMMEARHGIPLQRLKVHYDNYQAKKSEFNAPIAGNLRNPASWTQESFLAYDKGALAAYLLDKEIRSLTQGKKTLTSLLQKLYSQYGLYKKTLDEEQLLGVAMDIAGKEIKPFFDRYIHNSEELTLGTDFTDFDRDGLIGAAEILLGTDAHKADSDGDGVSDFIEHQNYTNPLDKASKPDLFLAVDGSLEDWGKIPYKSYADPEGDGENEIDIIEIGISKQNGFYYVFVKFNSPAQHDSRLRYYINLKHLTEKSARRNFAAVTGRPGDTSRFKPDGSSFDYQSMEDVPGMLSFVGEGVEFQIPVEFVDNSSAFQVLAGVWDVRENKGLDHTDWLTIN